MLLISATSTDIADDKVPVLDYCGCTYQVTGMSSLCGFSVSYSKARIR